MTITPMPDGNIAHCSICQSFAWNRQTGTVALCTAYSDDGIIGQKYKPLQLAKTVDYYETKPDMCDKYKKVSYK